MMAEIGLFNSQFLIILFIFFLIALVYSSVGFGGGSSYLAILAVAAINFQVIRSTALLCNIVVVTVGTYIFYKEGKLELKKALPLILSSVPFAYLGGWWPIQQEFFFLLLGATLMIVALVLWLQPQKIQTPVQQKYNSTLFNLVTGSALGFLSVLVGIGGGIFLSPILHFVGWDDSKKISAMASFFILVNSLSGLAGQLQKNTDLDWNFIWPLLLVVFIGGQIGSRLGAKKFNSLYIKRITAILILVAGTKIFIDHI